MSEPKAVSIYGLIDPRCGMIRYIGKANDPAKRFASHVRDSARRMTPVYAWFRKLASLGLEPEMLVLTECENWEAEERRLIAVARAGGHKLLNVAEGGDQPHCPHEVRSANGHKGARAREDDIVKRTIHRFMRNVGYALAEYRKGGDAQRIQKLAAAMAVLRRRAKEDPNLLYGQIIARGYTP